MFFKLAMRNSRRSRKENGLFFASLVVSIVAFYIILALSHQDVMIFLRSLESDAVNSLLQIAAVFYVFSLVMLFFLIYYASKYQLERRRHELGMYIMMGMRRSKLFALLIAEDLGSSVVALLIGLPIAILMSEVVSLLTARLVGLGVIGHHVSFSLQAVILTSTCRYTGDREETASGSCVWCECSPRSCCAGHCILSGNRRLFVDQRKIYGGHHNTGICWHVPAVFWSQALC